MITPPKRHIPDFLKDTKGKKDTKDKSSPKPLNKSTPDITPNHPVRRQVEIVFDSDDEEREEKDESNPSGCKVVKILRKGGNIVVDCDVYIGRRCTMGGWDLKGR